MDPGTMKEHELGTVIARRVFDCGENNVMLEIGAPYPIDKGPDCWCPYRITGMGDGVVKRIGGVDSVQALYLALQMAASDLYCSDAAREKVLQWAGQRNLGLPFPQVVADLVPPEDE
jgi:hypothetical protein